MICYYHNDLDGRCAGAIVRRHFVKIQSDNKFIEMEYSSMADLDLIGMKEVVVIVDFSFKPEIMEQIISKTKNIIWIDHHKTAFEYKYSIEMKGLRDIDYAGSELAWMYFFPNEKMPRSIGLIGDRDKWAWKYGEETAQFNQGMKIFAHQPTDLIWIDLLNSNERVSEITKAGEICLKFRDGFCKDYAEGYGFETEFESYKCFALGLYQFGSEAFGQRIEEYDICLSFEFLGDKWIIGLYSKKIDVSEIAKKYGGGGHKGAAGFVFDKLPFKKAE